MRVAAAILGLFLLSASADGFFGPFSTDQRIAASSLIAIVEVTKVDGEKGVSEATVIQGVLGSVTGQRIELWDDWQIEKDGRETRISGRDPAVEAGKRYLVYLTLNKRGRLVTVQSSLDCLQVVGKDVEKEGGKGFEPLADKLAGIRALLANRKKAEREARASDRGKSPE